MNTPTITMPRQVARDQLRAYRSSLHRRADAEYEAVAQGLEHLAKGTPLLNLADCFRDCPTDRSYRPRLAIARADRSRVWFRRVGNGRGEFTTRTNSRGAGTLTFTLDVPSTPKDYWTIGGTSGSALVPMIPAQVREKVGSFDAAKRFLLWEVEEWADIAPRDPYLLQHVGGELYAILAEWDLTELERAVMAGRAR